MIQTQLTIINKLGLHARAAAKFVACTQSYSSSIRVGQNDELIDGKSIMSVMMLAAGQGTILNIEIDGQDEDEALAGLSALIEDRFEEAE
ncbi:MAG: HPr family phosphocarrier protein [Halioglobus sp.]